MQPETNNVLIPVTPEHRARIEVTAPNADVLRRLALDYLEETGAGQIKVQLQMRGTPQFDPLWMVETIEGLRATADYFQTMASYAAIAANQLEGETDAKPSPLLAQEQKP